MRSLGLVWILSSLSFTAAGIATVILCASGLAAPAPLTGIVIGGLWAAGGAAMLAFSVRLLLLERKKRALKNRNNNGR